SSLLETKSGVGTPRIVVPDPACKQLVATINSRQLDVLEREGNLDRCDLATLEDQLRGLLAFLRLERQMRLLRRGARPALEGDPGADQRNDVALVIEQFQSHAVAGKADEGPSDSDAADLNL